MTFGAIFPGGLKWHFSDFRMHFWGFGVSGLCRGTGRLQLYSVYIYITHILCFVQGRSNFQHLEFMGLRQKTSKTESLLLIHLLRILFSFFPLPHPTLPQAIFLETLSFREFRELLLVV